MAAPLGSLESAPEAQVTPGLRTPQRLIQSALSSLINLVFPPRCAGCGRVDYCWCDRCQTELEATPFTTDVRPLVPLAGMASTGVHDGRIQQAIWSLKYENGRDLALPLGDRLTAHLETLNWTFDMIVPVPMHTTRLAERGYNQAQLLSEQVARRMNRICHPTALYRERYTVSQVGLGRDERVINVKDAFRAEPALVNNKTLLLIDDVYTTGATLSACAEAALAAGAEAVYGLTVSVARH